MSRKNSNADNQLQVQLKNQVQIQIKNQVPVQIVASKVIALHLQL